MWDIIRKLGADHILNPVEPNDTLATRVQDLTGGGADVVFDYVGEHGTPELGLAFLRNRGSYFTIGYGGEVSLPTLDLISREISVVGNLVGTYTDLEELMALTADGRVTLHTSSYPLGAYAEAIRDLEAGKVTGRAILVPEGR
ncbi:zinc-binding dehydrogenase [Streptomyces sp. NPDC048637]|uniref:zinc-binding dehydrogenase n=1 Tax=Streptomyces sp. NPDC048637 TaxID=3155636 RepID=UPI0034243C58